MANTYNWKVMAMSCLPEVGSMDNYVISVVWALNGDNGKWTTEDIFGTVEFEVNPRKPDYVPYDELQETEVLDWVFASLGVQGKADQEAIIDTYLIEKTHPLVVSPLLPWNK